MNKNNITAKAIGIDSSGCEIVNYIFNQKKIKNIELVACSQSESVLQNSKISSKFKINNKETKFLNEIVEFSKENLLKSDLVFFIGSLGESITSKFISEIKNVSTNERPFTIALLTFPFKSEGGEALKLAFESIQKLQDKVDSLIIISNDKILNSNSSFTQDITIQKINDLIFETIKYLMDLIDGLGEVSVGFEDLITVLRGSGTALIGIAEDEGENRALMIAEKATSPPFMHEFDILGAQKVLLSIISGEEAELELEELTIITEFIQSKLGSNAEIIFGHSSSSILGKKVKLLIIVAGLTHKVLPSLDLDFENLEKTINTLKLGFNNDKDTLPLYFLEEEYSNSEIAEIISFLSDIYREIGGDKLVIKGTSIFEFIPDLEPSKS